VVIFGGGGVGERKANLFYPYAEVKVASREFSPALMEMGNRGYLELIKADLPDQAKEVLHGSFLAIPATNDHQLNLHLEKTAKNMGIMVNNVNGVGDVVVPSIVRKDPVTIAISTQGKSPALSKYLRKKLERDLNQKYGDMARLLGEIRPILKEAIPDQKERKRILWEIISDQDVWNLLDQSYEKAYKRAKGHLNIR